MKIDVAKLIEFHERFPDVKLLGWGPQTVEALRLLMAEVQMYRNTHITYGTKAQRKKYEDTQRATDARLNLGAPNDP